jgi:hypothetical protein
MMTKHWCLALAFSLPASGFSQELRPLSTDRPDTTESPHTVDAGHFQFELEAASWERDGGNNTYNFTELNAKVGLDRCTDLQLVLPFFSHEEGGSEGFGDMQLRLKRNIWGNDEGSTALALMPYIKLPTANGDLGNGEIEGGLIVPLGFDGPAGWSCGVMTQFDLTLDADGSGYHAAFLNSATASHDLTESTAAFFELVSILSTDSDAHSEAYFNSGCTWGITPTVQLDGGIRVGLTDASVGFTPFVGLSVKY